MRVCRTLREATRMIHRLRFDAMVVRGLRETEAERAAGAGGGAGHWRPKERLDAEKAIEPCTFDDVSDRVWSKNSI